MIDYRKEGCINLIHVSGLREYPSTLMGYKIIIYGGFNIMAIITWCSGEIPANLKVNQVYGLIFSSDGRMLLRIEDNKYKLAGGRPEEYDADMEATLKRELLEEVNVVIGTAYMVGYQLVDEENGSIPYAQVRMAAVIENIGPSKPDSDNGRIYGRFLTPPTKVPQLLNWGQVGHDQVTDAVEVARKFLGITTHSDEDTIISEN